MPATQKPATNTSQEPKRKDIQWLKEKILSVAAESNVFCHTFAELANSQMEAPELSDQSKIDFRAFFNQVVNYHIDNMDAKIEKLFKEFEGGSDN